MEDVGQCLSIWGIEDILQWRHYNKEALIVYHDSHGQYLKLTSSADGHDEEKACDQTNRNAQAQGFGDFVGRSVDFFGLCEAISRALHVVEPILSTIEAIIPIAENGYVEGSQPMKNEKFPHPVDV